MEIGPVALPLLQYVCLPRLAATCGLRGTCEGREPCWARRPVSSLQRKDPEWRYSLRAQLHLQLARGCRLAVITSPLPPSLPASVPLQFNTAQSYEVTVTGPRSLTVQWTVQPDVRATSYTFTRWAGLQSVHSVCKVHRKPDATWAELES